MKLLLTPRCRRARSDTGIILALYPSIPTAFAHARCISPSVTAFSSFIRRATSLLRGRQGGSRRTPQNQCCGTFLSRCVRTVHTHLLFAQRAKNITCPKGRYNRAGRHDITRGKAADITETRQQSCRISLRRSAPLSALPATSSPPRRIPPWERKAAPHFPFQSAEFPQRVRRSSPMLPL